MTLSARLESSLCEYLNTMIKSLLSLFLDTLNGLSSFSLTLWGLISPPDNCSKKSHNSFECFHSSWSVDTAYSSLVDTEHCCVQGRFISLLVLKAYNQQWSAQHPKSFFSSLFRTGSHPDSMSTLWTVSQPAFLVSKHWCIKMLVISQALAKEKSASWYSNTAAFIS